jgi:hypothetical protein
MVCEVNFILGKKEKESQFTHIYESTSFTLYETNIYFIDVQISRHKSKFELVYD